MLSLNHSTVFRRLNALEEGIGTRLFERARSGYTPTPAGEEMIELAGRLAEQIFDFERRVAGRDVKPSGELRVTTNDSFVAHLLSPMFAAFCRQCPDIIMDVVIDNRALNLSKRDADVALRATSDPPETLIGRRVATLAWSIYGTAEALTASLANGLGAMPWVGFGEPISAIGPARWLAKTYPQARIVYRLNSVLGLTEAVGAGIGIGLLPCYIGDRAPNLKRLTPDLMDFNGGGLWLLTHPDLRTSARVRTFMDFMGRELTKMRPLLEGRG